MRFLAGFLTASGLWGAAFYAYTAGAFGKTEATTAPDSPALADAREVADAHTGKPRRHKPRRRAASPGEGNASKGTGDDALGWDEAQRLDLAAGEERLSGAQIEAGFDSAMPRIRRCLVLVPASQELTGQLTFGMRVGPHGRPTAVQLDGPREVVGGESGTCLREAARAIQFPTFDGPDTVFKFPVTLH